MSAKVKCALFSGVILLSWGPLVSARSQCSRLDKDKPPVFITFERLLVKSHRPEGRDALLRLHNNTGCGIVVPSNDEGPSLDLSALRREHVLKWTNAFTNGRTVTLVYNIHNYRGVKGTTSVSDGCMVYERTLESGESVLFSVPLLHFNKGADVSVRTEYVFEDKSVSSLGDDLVQDVFFRHQFLPKNNARR